MTPEEENDKKLRTALFVSLAILVIVPLVLIVGSLVSQTFYDNIVFKYYWGPIANDAGATLKSESAYNVVSTITYGIMVLAGLVASYIILFKRFRDHNTKPDLWFFLSITPLIIGGSVLRTLEDAEIFRRPFTYLFITPIIYGVLWAFAILMSVYSFKILAIYNKRREGANPFGCCKPLKPLEKVPGFVFIFSIFIIMDIVYLGIYFLMTGWYNFLPHPFIPILISLAYMTVLYYLQRNQGKELTYFKIFTFFTTYLLLIGVAMIIQWPNNTAWLDHYTSLTSWDGMNLIEFPMVLGLALLCTIAICIPSYLLRRSHPKLGVFAIGPNVLIIFGHFLDASATYRAIDHHGYVEKHVLPEFFINLFNTALVMFPIKAIIVIMFILLVDVYFKNNLPKDKNEAFQWVVLIGIIKVIVLMVGLGPGLRDIFRLGMGI